ncbi:hypothetical protein DAMA08_019950 [Martiniozyma asiatica (nom. inval.)]|nr:hypothetical protein DAMA08_019950 [Martiniozyma asiatica]
MLSFIQNSAETKIPPKAQPQAYPNNEEFDIPQTVFQNPFGVPAPEVVTARSITEFRRQIANKVAANFDDAFRSNEKANQATQIICRVEEAAAAVGVFDVPNNIERSFAVPREDIAALRRDMNEGFSSINCLLQRQHFRNLVDDNERLHRLHLRSFSIPFIVGEMLGDLPAITNAFKVIKLSRNQVAQYLTGYDVAFDPEDQDAQLRQRLMLTLGYCL